LLEPALDTRGPSPEPGLREQIDRTVETARRLFEAHKALLIAELEPIKANIAAVSAAAALAVGAALFAVMLISIATTLFLGEAIFGSMGWGIVHGTLTAVMVIVGAASFIVRDDRGLMGRALAIGLLVGVAVGLILGFQLPYQGWVAVTDALNLGVAEEVRLPLVAIGLSVIVGAIVGTIVGLRAARSSRPAAPASPPTSTTPPTGTTPPIGTGPSSGGSPVANGLVAGVFGGIAFGVFTVIPYGPDVAAALGVVAGQLTFVAVLGIDLATRPIDEADFRARFLPEQSIAAAQQTLEWLQEQTPGGGE
jgi:hypothetical protein